MKHVKFFTTFSKNGYHVYGKLWIDSFLSKTKEFPNITADIYIDKMTQSELDELSVPDKLNILSYESNIPDQRPWINHFNLISKHNDHVKKLTIKFSFKSFVIYHALQQAKDTYAVWLDADCIFTSSNFEEFPQDILNGKFVACQKEAGSEHVESGIVIFDADHMDKEKFLNRFRQCYYDEINEFGELYDGFVINRTLANTQIDYVDLNVGYGLGGVQSDPNCTFLNPVIRSRFLHNIGISGKRQYNDWKTYAKQDEFFKAIHGIDPSELGITKQNKLKSINDRVKQLSRKR